MNKNLLFRSIPKVDILLEEQEIQDLIDVYGREFVMDVIREEMDALRTFIGKCEEEEKAKAQIGMLTQNIKRHAGKLHEPNMKMEQFSTPISAVHRSVRSMLRDWQEL